MRLGIRAKLVSTLVLAGLLPLALALAIILIGVVELRIGSKGRMYRALAQERAAHLSTILTAQVELVEMINNLPGMNEFLERVNERPPLTPAQIDQIEAGWPGLRENQGLLGEVLQSPLSHRWQAVVKSERRFNEVLITDGTGRLVGASNKSTDYFQADEEWWQACYARGKGMVTISDVIFDESSMAPGGRRGTYVVDLCVPIYAPGEFGPGEVRRVVGITKVSMDVRWILAQIDVPAGADEIGHAVWLAREDGRPVPGAAHRAPSRDLSPRLAKALRDEPQSWLLDNDFVGYELVGFASVERGRLIDVQAQRWRVIIAAGRSAVLTPVARLAWLILILGVVVITIFFIGGLWVGQRHIIRPLHALQEAFDRVRGGDRSVRLPEPGGQGGIFQNDELGRLAQNFNMMIDQLRATLERLEEADALKRQFIDLASHELRTPITYILGAAQLAQRHAANGDGAGNGGMGGGGAATAAAAAASFLARIAAKAQRLNRIVENMFKLLAGEERFEKRLRLSEVDVSDVIHAVCQEHDPFVRERRQHWQIDAPETLPPLRADAEKVRDIVANLVSNAIRFSPDGGLIRVGASLQEDGAIEIAVGDSGPGIPEADLPNLFQPFFTGAGLRQTSGDFQFMSHGMGLGLSVVKRFVELHGGTVCVDSSNKGTTVRVTLRSAPAGGAGAPGSGSNSSNGHEVAAGADAAAPAGDVPSSERP